jgi:pentatricopeptide repeat protein
MAFTAMIGKELLELDYETDEPDKMIMSTYVHSSGVNSATNEESLNTSEQDNEGVNELKETRPGLDSMLDDSRSHLVASASKCDNLSSQNAISSGRTDDAPLRGRVSSEPRSRFTDSLSTLQIEEAKATGRAQLGLAFEMLTMMKKRALRADPEAYQCLIDACGRVGDTHRATDLLAKMHEDGIVADGTVYACLVSAFSAETAWKKGTKEEDLPGKKCR